MGTRRSSKQTPVRASHSSFRRSLPQGERWATVELASSLLDSSQYNYNFGRAFGGHCTYGCLRKRNSEWWLLYGGVLSVNMETGESSSQLERYLRMIVSVGVLSGVTVVLGYGGWIVLTLTAKLGGYDPRTEDEDLLRERFRAWPDRNREVMRTNGKRPLRLKP